MKKIIVILLLCYGVKNLAQKNALQSPVEYSESSNSQIVANKPVLVTFECGSCKAKNKFDISGPENHTYKKVIFPIKQLLKPGEYEMTYWQNKVQQIHLPFTVSSESNNIIIVKE